ncbi:PhyH-domain-containing protein [Tilletiaria anomala UBC 951]|uniref:PhyH-domain-containing protein n=1 Tax=Tilletiaria anomala (strain ATCC 24038 / CBS 436.72 / UBC 951) TaxID=1037660 RepID=A0A066WRF1_TILAU|nr:PhyH-domain-containing protein [Tilletiaria anomala UBC 951]KDN53584.1 PhyH-domain-containing protein [Tilletiaria anomala UBC 951]
MSDAPLSISNEPYMLSPEQITSFEQQGFLILRDFLADTSSVQTLRQWTQQVHDWPLVKGKWMPYQEKISDGRMVLTRTENYSPFHPGFNALFRGDRLMGVLKQLSGEEMILFKEKINYKLPKAGGFDAHQDAPAYTHAGALKHLTVNIAVDKATLENGCLEVVPGSHRMNIPVGSDNCIPKDWEDANEWILVPLKPGDVLIFGSYLAHRSGPNSSSNPRAAIYATFNAVSDGGDRFAEYYINRRAEWPPMHEREEGKDYSLGALRYGFGSPMTGATQHSRMQTELFGATVSQAGVSAKIA